MVVKKEGDVHSSSIGAVYCFRGRGGGGYCEAEQMEQGIGGHMAAVCRPDPSS